MQSGGNKLRYATLMGIKRAKTKELRTVNAAELGVEAAPVVTLEQISAPKKQKSTQILAGIGERSRGSAGREAEDGGARAMSVLLVLEESNGKIKRASWEALAAALQAWCRRESITAVVIGAQTEALAAEAAAKACRQSCPRRASAARAVHGRWFLRSLCSNSSKTRAPRKWFFRTPTRCAIMRRRWPAAWARC